MVRLGGTYDASQYDPRESFDPLPAGWYAMQAITTEVRPTKDGANQYLWVEFEVLENHHPDLKGRRAWERMNLWHSNQQAVDIANRTLSGICRAIGRMKIDDTDELLHQPLAVKLKVVPATAQFEAKNELTAYEPLAARFQHGSPVPQGTQTAPMAPAPPPPGAGRPAPAAPAAATAPPHQPEAQPGAAKAPPWKR